VVAQAQTRGIVIGKHELERLIATVQAATAADTHAMLDAIGQQQEDAARRRIYETKSSPDGERWPAWSRAYAETRGAQHSLLLGEGELAESMTHEVLSRDAVEIGSPMVYAGVHLYGAEYSRVRDRAHVRIKARPYLDTEPGFGDAHDRQEIRDITREFLGGLLKGAA
jgi:phage virion morphogenesis protein